MESERQVMLLVATTNTKFIRVVYMDHILFTGGNHTTYQDKIIKWYLTNAAANSEDAVIMQPNKSLYPRSTKLW